MDEQLPLKIFEKKKAHGGFRRGNTFQPEKVEDYWALLLEKVKNSDSGLACEGHERSYALSFCNKLFIVASS